MVQENKVLFHTTVQTGALCTYHQHIVAILQDCFAQIHICTEAAKGLIGKQSAFTLKRTLAIHILIQLPAALDSHPIFEACFSTVIRIQVVVRCLCSVRIDKPGSDLQLIGLVQAVNPSGCGLHRGLKLDVVVVENVERNVVRIRIAGKAKGPQSVRLRIAYLHHGKVSIVIAQDLNVRSIGQQIAIGVIHFDAGRINALTPLAGFFRICQTYRENDIDFHHRLIQHRDGNFIRVLHPLYLFRRSRELHARTNPCRQEVSEIFRQT